MDNFEILKSKLEAFIRKFYLNELLKGLIFFIAIGLLYFLITIFIEYLLWLNPTGRSILFWSFVLVELFLFGRFIIFPLLKLFKLSGGINYTEASRIIGKHFPEVNDKLLNVLQLKENSHKSDLLIASIDQKSEELRPVPFSMAVDFKKNLPFLKYAAIPVLIILIILFSGRTELFSSSYERVVNYKTAYEPPAPFAFELEETDLTVRENEPFKIRVATVGELIPENASVHYNGQSYFLSQVSPGIFEHTFDPAQESYSFYFSGNKVKSRPYEVEVIRVPKMRNFKMLLDYPAHTGMEDEIIEGTGNASVPEGTVINWQLETSATDKVKLSSADTTVTFQKHKNSFSLEKRIVIPLNYNISTSNEDVEDYENLAYQLKVVRDEFPELVVDHRIDSLDNETHYFYGKYSDDYGIRAVQLVYFPQEEPENLVRRQVGDAKESIGEFVGSFPDTLALEKGRSYDFYFEVIDNDVINGYKRSKSEVFSYRSKTETEERDERLQEQDQAIEGMDESLEEMKLSQKELEELNRIQKENSKLNYNDRKKLENFLKRQKQQNQIMESYTEKLKRNLSNEESPENEQLKEELEKRISNREKELRENEKLLEELEKYADKIQEEGLSEKLEKLSKNAKNQERSMEQLLELTKKYYVQEKAKKISDDLQRLGEEQEKLAEETEQNSKAAQDSISEETKETMEELEELSKENESLKKPTDLGRDAETEEEIKEEQKKASDQLEQGENEPAKKSQKKAGEQLKQLSQKMQQQMAAEGAQQMQEDVEMLRQILDNLVTFSFEQEDLMEQFKKMGQDNASLGGKLRRQDLLKEHFQHVDDSLYSLALRNEMISEQVTKKLTDVDYNLEQALDRLSQNEIRQGVGSQQYVITGANDLAYLLSQILGQMEQMLNPGQGSGSGGAPNGKSGQGEGRGKQLQDIIKKQGELSEQMKEGARQGGEQKGQGEKGEGKDGESGDSEESSGELFRIFQEQQMLRKALEERMKKEGLKNGAGEILKEMQQIEKEILEKGFNPETQRRMQELEHKLLELEEAELEQGRKPERESNTSKEQFKNETKDQIIRAREYFNTTEILNRQSLPLRQIYKQKVKEYFERTDN